LSPDCKLNLPPTVIVAASPKDDLQSPLHEAVAAGGGGGGGGAKEEEAEASLVDAFCPLGLEEQRAPEQEEMQPTPSASSWASGAESQPTCSSEEATTMKAPAFRAVVQNDGLRLAEILALVPLETWSSWENKAGKGLLTLSEERGSQAAYAILARALGLLQERKHSAFEEREDVWVFVDGDVQPRRATVLEDASEEAETVRVEFWDGDSPPQEVDHSLVSKVTG